jgi:ATP-dependent Lon protease
MRKIPTGELGKINLDQKILADAPLIKGSGSKKRKYTKKIINLACSSEKINLQQYEISLLECIGVEKFEKEDTVVFGKIGKSAGSTLYLALLSAFHKKPISRQMAATGALAGGPKKGKVNNQEVQLAAGTNLPIGGLKEKTLACYQKGINKLVLSKYNSTPNLLSESRKRSDK